jgi:hypothetical protein
MNFITSRIVPSRTNEGTIVSMGPAASMLRAHRITLEESLCPLWDGTAVSEVAAHPFQLCVVFCIHGVARRLFSQRAS